MSRFDSEDKQSLKETEKIAELAPNAKTISEEQTAIETIEDNASTVQEQKQIPLGNNINELCDRLILTNIQLMTNEEIATESMKIYNEFVTRLTKFNMSVMRMCWIPFLTLTGNAIETNKNGGIEVSL